MNYSDIKKEFDIEFDGFEKSCKFYCEYHKVGKTETLRICSNLKQIVKRIWKAKMNEVIDDMIGEEIIEDSSGSEFEKLDIFEKAFTAGMKTQRKRLKEYKKKFNI